MIIVLARFEMQKGKENVALQAINSMAEDVREKEPGCLIYAVARGQVNPQEIYIYEVYADDGAFQAHRHTSHMRELQAAFDEALNRASFNVEILNSVVGFVRPEAVAV
jgi:quinol monooxygenase YgiN